jgi:hypothetical protein
MKPCHYPHFDAFLARGCGRQHRAWSGALAEPQEYGVSTHQARGCGRQLFVIRHFIIIEIEPMAVARIRFNIPTLSPKSEGKAACLCNALTTVTRIYKSREVVNAASTVEIFPNFMNRPDSVSFLSGSSATNPTSSLDVLQKDFYRPSCRSSRRNDRWPKPNPISCRARSTC